MKYTLENLYIALLKTQISQIYIQLFIAYKYDVRWDTVEGEREIDQEIFNKQSHNIFLRTALTYTFHYQVTSHIFLISFCNALHFIIRFSLSYLYLHYMHTHITFWWTEKQCGDELESIKSNLKLLICGKTQFVILYFVHSVMKLYINQSDNCRLILLAMMSLEWKSKRV